MPQQKRPTDDVDDPNLRSNTNNTTSLKRPCYNPDYVVAPLDTQLPPVYSGQDVCTGVPSDSYTVGDMFQPTQRRPTPFSLPQQLPVTSMMPAAYQQQQLSMTTPRHYLQQVAEARHPMAPRGQQSVVGQPPSLSKPQSWQQQQQQQQQQMPKERTSSLQLPPVPPSASNTSIAPALAAAARPAAPGAMQPPPSSAASSSQQQQQQHSNLLSQLQAQMDQARQAAALQQLPPGRSLQQEPDWGAAMADLLRLLPRLNQEYKREMHLLLRACQVAGQVNKYSLPNSAAGAMLLLDPAAKDQLQRQVLSNCNDKHAAVTAAFRVAAQAVAAAASNVSVGKAALTAAAVAAAQAAEAFGVPGDSNNDELAAQEVAANQAASEAVNEALQQLRASYQQELVAATSALFAICRGFGQSNTLAAASSQPIKQALCAAQQQHLRVEQMWQDLMLAAAGGCN